MIYGYLMLIIFLSVIFYILLEKGFFISLNRKNLSEKTNNYKKNAFIVVMGDIGRSPRMNYHCLSLVKLGYYITIFGYKGLRKTSIINLLIIW